MGMSDMLTALNLPSAVQAQALKLLTHIAQAHSAADLWRATDRAEGLCWVWRRSRR